MTRDARRDLATPERDALTASVVHQSVDYQPITGYDLAAGYLNLPGLTTLPDQY